MIVSIIAAMAKNRTIGFKGSIPWRIPADLEHFKNLTMGHYILMGRKTYESIGGPLPGRLSVIITRQPGYKAPGCRVAHSISKALEISKKDNEVFIIGGAQIYKQFLDSVDRIYLTLIHKDFLGDVYFPKFDETAWVLVSRQDYDADKENLYPFSFLVYQRQK